MDSEMEVDGHGGPPEAPPIAEEVMEIAHEAGSSEPNAFTGQSVSTGAVRDHTPASSFQAAPLSKEAQVVFRFTSNAVTRGADAQLVCSSPRQPGLVYSHASTIVDHFG